VRSTPHTFEKERERASHAFVSTRKRLREERRSRKMDQPDCRTKGGRRAADVGHVENTAMSLLVVMMLS
jgi:hypothetical protein